MSHDITCNQSNYVSLEGLDSRLRDDYVLQCVMLCLFDNFKEMVFNDVWMYIWEMCGCTYGRRLGVRVGDVWVYVWETCGCTYGRYVGVHMGDV